MEIIKQKADQDTQTDDNGIEIYPSTVDIRPLISDHRTFKNTSESSAYNASSETTDLFKKTKDYEININKTKQTQKYLD